MVQKFLRVSLVFMLVFALGLAVACSPAEDDLVDYPYDDDVITFTFGGQETEYTVAELRALAPVTEEITRWDDEGNITSQYPVKGVLLETVLADMGIDIDDLDAIRFVAGDGYAVEVPKAVFADKMVILAYQIDGEALFEGTAPLRAFIPGEEAMYWVKNLTQVVLNPGAETGAEVIEQIFFFETLLAGLEPSDYEAEEDAMAVTTAEVFAGVNPSDSVFMLASDGFEKTEEYGVFIAEFIVTQGQNTPAFRGPDLPRGMHVRDLVWMSSGDTGFLVVENALEFFELDQVEEFIGVNLLELVEYFGLKQADSYILEASDGFSVEIAHEDLDKGIVYIREDSGQVATRFDDLPRNTSIRDLMSLRPADQE